MKGVLQQSQCFMAAARAVIRVRRASFVVVLVVRPFETPWSCSLRAIHRSFWYFQVPSLALIPGETISSEEELVPANFSLFFNEGSVWFEVNDGMEGL
eukprot:scaffold141858_cov80-Attheya_sp.AAC.2